MGYHRAGFEVTGVDVVPQPRYPFTHAVADVLTLTPGYLRGFDLIHASPPCQAHSLGSQRWIAAGRTYPDLIAATRELLEAAGVPWVLENVPRAPVRADVVLRGEMFGLKVCRQRHFELGGWWCMAPALPLRGSVKRGDFVTCAGHGGHGSNSLAVWRKAIGIDWMSKQETAEAIPPCYTEHLGREFMAQQLREVA